MEQRVGVIRSLLQMEQQVGVRSLLFSRRDIGGYIWCPPNELGILFINIVCSPASMVIACGHSAFLHWGFQLMASKVQWCKHMSNLLTFSWNQKIERKKLCYSKVYLSLFPLTHGAVVDRYFIIISWCQEFHTLQKNMHSLLCQMCGDLCF
jgi:hypothetical protein